MELLSWKMQLFRSFKLNTMKTWRETLWIIIIIMTTTTITLAPKQTFKLTHF